MKKGLLTIAFLPAVMAALASCEPASPYDFVEADSSKGSVGYEIFVPSFSDSDGDGIGDFRGIENRVSYLSELGIRRVWLSPIHPSPSYHKYDVADYYAVDEDYGTLEDFDSMVSALHGAGIDVILDLVLNHTSDENPWFEQSARDRGEGKTGADSKADWYEWADQGSGSGWSYSPLAKAAYRCAFSTDMPELNLDSSAVRAEIGKIASFWLDEHDVDGFRLDATTYYYDNDTAKNVEFLTFLRETCEQIKDDVYIVGEAWIDSQAALSSYAASGIRFFNFPTACTADGKGNLSTVAACTPGTRWSYYGEAVEEASSSFYEQSGKRGLTAFFISNHDEDRWAAYFNAVDDGESRMKLAATMNILSPGTPWIYYGEEIKMNGRRSDDNSENDRLRRQGFVWGGGVEKCDTPDGGKDTNGDTPGALDELKNPSSLLSHYRRSINLRNAYNDLFEFGEFLEASFDGEKEVSFLISEGGSEYALVFNLTTSSQIELGDDYELLDSICPDGTKSEVEGTTLKAGGYSATLLEKQS